MALRQASAQFFIYLVLSGHFHAFRIKSFSGFKKQPQSQDFAGTTHATAETAVEEFHAKVRTFSTEPSMGPLGSGGQILTFFHSLSQEDKRLVMGELKNDVKAMLDGERKLGNSVVELELGINQWLENRRKQFLTKQKYENCQFSFAPLVPLFHRDMRPDDLAKAAPAAFADIWPEDSDLRSCELRKMLNHTLAEHMGLANHAINIAKGLFGNDGSSKAFLTQAEALLEVKPAEMQVEGIGFPGAGMMANAVHSATKIAAGSAYHVAHVQAAATVGVAMSPWISCIVVIIAIVAAIFYIWIGWQLGLFSNSTSASQSASDRQPARQQASQPAGSLLSTRNETSTSGVTTEDTEAIAMQAF